MNLVPNPDRPKKRRTRRQVRLQSVPSAPSAPSSSLRLRSAAPERKAKNKKAEEIKEKYRFGAQSIKEAKKYWHHPGTRYRHRVEVKRKIKHFLPRGTVGDQIKGSLGPECSSCDERTQKNRGPAAEFARKRLALLRRRVARSESVERVSPALNLRRPKALKKPKVKAAPIVIEEEEEEEPVPAFDDADFGDGSGDDPSTGAAAASVAAIASH